MMMDSGFIGAIIGAVIGGVLTFFVATADPSVNAFAWAGVCLVVDFGLAGVGYLVGRRV